MLINSDKFLIWFSKIIKYKNHPFELENKNIMTFEEWEYLKAPVTMSYFKDYFDLKSCFIDKSILDIGCGGGGKTIYLHKFSPSELIGVDINTEFINKAVNFSKQFDINPRTKVKFMIGDAENLPFESESFDFITMMDTFEHFSNPEKVLKEAGRVLKKNGMILISFPPFYHPFGAHVRDLIPIPWVHIFFSEKAIASAYYKLSFFKKDGEMRRNLKIGRDEFGNYNINYINKMTLNKCRNILKAVDLNLKYFKLIPLWYSFMPFRNIKVHEIFIKNVVIILKKGE